MSLGLGKDLLAGTFFGFAHASGAVKISGRVMRDRLSISVS
jgi:hypothetical protein